MPLFSLDEKSFRRLLANNKLEDISMIDGIGRLIMAKRDFVFRMPRPGETAVLMLSGGIDSIVSWAMLLEEFRLRVYPVFLLRGLPVQKKELQAIHYFSRVYAERYKENFIAPHMVNILMPELTEPFKNLVGYLHPDVAAKHVTPDGGLSPVFSLGHFVTFPYLGFIYARQLNARKNINIKTIFCGTTYSDHSSYRTVTSARSVMLSLMLLSGEKEWQYSSIACEPELGRLLAKKDLIRWAASHGVPLWAAWSCAQDERYQCGVCLACRIRRDQFKRAHVMDSTKYMDARTHAWSSFTEKTKRSIFGWKL